MKKVLIVDDEVAIREVIVEYALLQNWLVDQADDGQEAIELVRKNHYDCIVLDVMMPHLDGFSACKKIREIQAVPIIILSARQEEFDKLYGFEIGADDYVAKPFSVKELIARMKVVMSRNQQLMTKQRYQLKGLTIDAKGRKVFVNQKVASLTPKEIDLLLYLLEHRNIAISREQILADVWKYDYFGDNRTVDTHIKMLRHNLGEYRDHIVTVRAVGYKFEDEEI